MRSQRTIAQLISKLVLSAKESVIFINREIEQQVKRTEFEKSKMQSIVKYSVISSSIRNLRQICTSKQLNEIFKICSMKEFDEKVKNSKTPVIVDFYAT